MFFSVFFVPLLRNSFVRLKYTSAVSAKSRFSKNPYNAQLLRCGQDAYAAGLAQNLLRVLPSKTIGATNCGTYMRRVPACGSGFLKAPQRKRPLRVLTHIYCAQNLARNFRFVNRGRLLPVQPVVIMSAIEGQNLRATTQRKSMFY